MGFCVRELLLVALAAGQLWFVQISPESALDASRANYIGRLGSGKKSSYSTFLLH